MKFIFHLPLLIASVPFLSLAKSTAEKRDTDASATVIRHLKKAGRKKPTRAPTTSKGESTQIFYSNTATFLEKQISAKSAKSSQKLLTYYIDLGVIKGHLSEKETMCLVQTSFTTSIDFDVFIDDDDVFSSMDAQVYLEILAYSGCDSAVTCKAANITPNPLIPEKVEMIGWYRDIGIDFDPPSQSEGIVEEFGWQDVMTSTNEANFLLVGKGAGDFFLQARISIYSDVFTPRSTKEASVGVLVHDWIVVVEEKDDDTPITESNGYTLSPTHFPTV